MTSPRAGSTGDVGLTVSLTPVQAQAARRLAAIRGLAGPSELLSHLLQDAERQGPAAGDHLDSPRAQASPAHGGGGQEPSAPHPPAAPSAPAPALSSAWTITSHPHDHAPIAQLLIAAPGPEHSAHVRDLAAHHGLVIAAAASDPPTARALHAEVEPDEASLHGEVGVLAASVVDPAWSRTAATRGWILLLIGVEPLPEQPSATEVSSYLQHAEVWYAAVQVTA